MLIMVCCWMIAFECSLFRTVGVRATFMDGMVDGWVVGLEEVLGNGGAGIVIGEKG